MTEPYPLPSTWEEFAKIREALGRIEATLGFMDQSVRLNASKIEGSELRLYALEQGRIANAASADAALSAALAARKLVEDYDLPPTHFKAWKAKVDEVVNTVINGAVSLQATTAMRKRDFAIFTAIAGLGGATMAAIPNIIKILSGG